VDPSRYIPSTGDLDAEAGMKYVSHHKPTRIVSGNQTNHVQPETLPTARTWSRCRRACLAAACAVPLLLRSRTGIRDQLPEQGRPHELPPQPGDQPDFLPRLPESKGARCVSCVPKLPVNWAASGGKCSGEARGPSDNDMIPHFSEGRDKQSGSTTATSARGARFRRHRRRGD